MKLDIKNIVSSIKDRPYILYALDAVVVVALAVISIVVFRVHFGVVLSIVVLDILLALCLHDVPIWLHGAVFLIEVISGFIFKKAVFMVFVAVIYVCAVASVYLLKQVGVLK